MARRKRAYIPKIKGCYECSQRRIDCDRAEPICGKCMSRGLPCSGLVKSRIRFVDNQVARNDRAGRTGSHASRANSASRVDDEFGSSVDIDQIPLSLDVLDGRSTYLLQYFSTKIATEMTVIDDNNNGWRSIILPTAHLDDLVRLSVVAAASLHLQPKDGQEPTASPPAYAQAVGELRKRQNLAVQSLDQRQGVLLALLVLLAATMIQGSSDFRILLDLVDKAIAAVGGEDAVSSGELGTFIIRQVRKYRGYASPMLSQAQGILVLSQTSPSRPSSSRGWEDFTSYYAKYSSTDHSLSIMYALNALACDLYVRRAQRGCGGRGFHDEVDLIRQNLEALPDSCPCEHALIWPTFIAALESEKQEHREYFRGKLQRHYARNGFGNILVALRYLEGRWGDDGVEVDWTRSLPELGAFVV